MQDTTKVLYFQAMSVTKYEANIHLIEILIYHVSLITVDIFLFMLSYLLLMYILCGLTLFVVPFVLTSHRFKNGCRCGAYGT
jgi:hypothetical protein